MSRLLYLVVSVSGACILSLEILGTRVLGPEALRGTERIGFSDVTVDSDGVVRRGLLFLDDGQNFSVSLPLRLALAYLAERD